MQIKKKIKLKTRLITLKGKNKKVIDNCPDEILSINPGFHLST